MTEKDQAEFLVMQFIKHSRADNEIKPIQSAIQCALVAVDEIIKTLSPYLGDNNARDYWEEVRAEIEKL